MLSCIMFQSSVPFYGWIVCCPCKPTVYPFISRWALVFSPHILAIINSAALNICAQLFVWTYLFISLEYIQAWVSKSHDNPMFNVLRNRQAVFHNGRTILHSCQQSMLSHFSRLLPTYVVFSCFIVIVPVGVKWYLFVVLVCILLITSGVNVL